MKMTKTGIVIPSGVEESLPFAWKTALEEKALYQLHLLDVH
jgi:hypothetical protein